MQRQNRFHPGNIVLSSLEAVRGLERQGRGRRRAGRETARRELEAPIRTAPPNERFYRAHDFRRRRLRHPLMARGRWKRYPVPRTLAASPRLLRSRTGFVELDYRRGPPRKVSSTTVNPSPTEGLRGGESSPLTEHVLRVKVGSRHAEPETWKVIHPPSQLP